MNAAPSAMPRILNSVMSVHIQIALNKNLKAKAAVNGKGSEHMVKKADTRSYINIAAVQIQGN